MSDNATAGAWKRQLAIFAGGVSAFTGIGVLLVVFYTTRDHSPKRETPRPPASSSIKN